ncbi:NAD(P)-binding protein [Coniochaeta ligniaria NRRL 30616]|uniref:NAD(P)-binding protein n=1 Tax=Coniochaeta ligniaria NRRL 30616 TaxID=1408157 RepID=A0A1J7IWE7_9PEZI|nr:NAD(P)-binding protein [Coniochaeta ligniaria NRRL 30616]
MMENHITLHKEPYPRIAPTRPELSQVGRTVLVLGGSTGIGHAIARNFCAAGASKVIILARRPTVLNEAVAKLNEAYADTEVVGRVGSFQSSSDAKVLWDSLQDEGVAVDVLVISATHQPAVQPIMEQGTARAWEDYEANVHAPLLLVDRFYHQPNHDRQKYCLFVSTQCIHDWTSAPQLPIYSITKSSFTAVMSMIARDTPAAKMQILSFHPGVVFTEAAKSVGYTETTIPWDNGGVAALLYFLFKLGATTNDLWQRICRDNSQYGPHLLQPRSFTDALYGLRGMWTNWRLGICGRRLTPTPST